MWRGDSRRREGSAEGALAHSYVDLGRKRRRWKLVGEITPRTGRDEEEDGDAARAPRRPEAAEARRGDAEQKTE